ncbi:fungal-specific transcription factor domain-containing protein [Obelidium mucronatum]|nr:fungal-specific transcription factor domain-containing protein [Obelidium mucronatum]
MHSNRVQQMESILSSLLRGSSVVKDEDNSTANDVDSEDSEDDYDDTSNVHGVKRARISEVLDEEAMIEGAVVASQSKRIPDMTHLINALNSSNNPESMKATLDLMNQLQFMSETGSVQPVKREQSKQDKGFRGIALSLQRKMRRGIQPSPKDPNSPSDYLVSSPNSPISTSSIHSGTKETRTIVEDLASDTILFFGSTSTTTSSAWRQSPRFAGGIMNISLSFEANPPCPKVIEGDYSPPCRVELVLHLVGMYFKHVHPYFPMIHKNRFFQQFKEKRTDHFNLLLNSMCALMSQQCRDLTAWGVTNPVELHMAFFERARVLLGHQFDWPHINNVQALLLLCIVGQGTNINATSYHYIGIAHRLAVELGMHRNLDNLRHPSLDPELLESMRTTWFCLYILDRYTSVVEGRPMAISDEEWDTPFPASKSAEINSLRHHVGLCEILGRIANFVNRPGRPGPSARTATFPHLSSTPSTQKDSKKIIEEISSHLNSWHQGLPTQWQQRPAQGSTWSFHHHLYVMFHTASVLLHRLDVGKFDQVCSKNATEISRVLDSLPVLPDITDKGKSPAFFSDFVFVLPLVVYSALTASTLFLDLALANKADDGGSKKRKSRSSKPTASLAGKVTPEMSKFAAKQLRKSLVAFDRLKTTSLFANYYGQLIVEVLRNDGIVLPSDADDDSSPPADTPPLPPAVATPASTSLFNFFSSSVAGPSSSVPSGMPSGSASSTAHQESITTRFANSMKAAVAEGVTNWNEFLHFSPKIQNNQLAPGFMNAASNISFPNLPNLPNLPNIPNPINALREFGSGLLYGHGNHMMSAVHEPIKPADSEVHGENRGNSSSSSSSAGGPDLVFADEEVKHVNNQTSQNQSQLPEAGGEPVSIASPFFSDIFSDLLNPLVENSLWNEVNLSGLGRRVPGFGISGASMVNDGDNGGEQNHTAHADGKK